MIKATRNQLGNVANKYQTQALKVLCVCSAGLLRSPTLANVLHSEYGFNTRACGVSKEYALIPISEALIAWADEIVFVSQENYDELDPDEEFLCVNKSIVLSTPDEYDWNDQQLRTELLAQYLKHS